MKRPESIIIRPLMTEKTNLCAVEGKYTFVVSKGSTKTEIKLAVESLFNVKVSGVNTINCRGKKKRMGVHVGNRPSWKKAIVTVDSDPKDLIYLEKGGKQVVTNKKYKSSIEEFGATH